MFTQKLKELNINTQNKWNSKNIMQGRPNNKKDQISKKYTNREK